MLQMAMHKYQRNIRFLRFQESTLFQMAWTKCILSAAYVAITELLQVEIKLIAVITLLIILDLISGLWASRLKHVPITSFRLRRTARKVYEYCVFLIAFTAVSNVFDWLAWVKMGAFAFVAITELKSVTENIFGEKAKVFEQILKLRSNFTNEKENK